MKIISLNLIYDYLSGKKIPNKKLEKIEGDRDYMICAMNKSNDYRLYRLCSDALKTDYDFVLYYINKFKDKVEAIDTAARYYISHSTNYINIYELKIIMKKLTMGYDHICTDYALDVLGNILIDQSSICSRIEDIKDISQKEKYGLGFVYIEGLYESSSIIMDTYAEKFIGDLCSTMKDRKQIEIEVHNEFNSQEALRKYGLNNYLLDYIAKHDICLAEYVESRISLLEPLKDTLFNICLRWDHYNDKLQDRKYRQIMNVYDEFMSSERSSATCNYYDLLKYAMKILGISDDLFDYKDSFYEEEYDDLYNHSITTNYFDENSSESRGFNSLVETINNIIVEKDPRIIKNIHIPSNECVVTRIRSDKNMLFY